jgi:NADP-dependent 3-hydroxy acid dehydrogenase YdfG
MTGACHNKGHDIQRTKQTTSTRLSNKTALITGGNSGIGQV